MLKLTFNSLSHRKMFFIFEIILLSFMLFLAGISFFMKFCSDYNIASSRRAYKKDLDKTGIIRISSESDKSKEFYKYLSKIKDISYSGNYIDIGGSIGNLSDIQKDNQEEPGYYTDNGLLEVTYITPGMTEISSADFGKTDTAGSELPVYLGWRYREKLKVGQVFTTGSGKQTVKYKITGFLDKGDQWPSKNVMDFNNINALCNTADTGYKVFVLYKDDMLFGSNIIINSKKNIDDIKSEIKEAADKFGIKESTVSFMEMIKAKEEENKSQRRTVNIMFVFMLIMSCTSICGHSILKNISDTRETAVLYSCGVSSSGIAGIMSIENIIKFVISILMSLAALTLWIRNIYSGNGGSIWMNRILHDVLMREVIPACILFSAVIFIVCTVVPYLFIKHMAVVDLIRSNFLDLNFLKTADIILFISFTVVFISLSGFVALNSRENEGTSKAARYERVIVKNAGLDEDPESYDKKVKDLNTSEFFKVLEKRKSTIKMEISAANDGILDSYPVVILFNDDPGDDKIVVGKSIKKIINGGSLNVLNNTFNTYRVSKYDESSEQSFETMIFWNRLDSSEKENIISSLDGVLLGSFENINISGDSYKNVNKDTKDLIDELKKISGISFKDEDSSSSEAENILVYLYYEYKKVISVVFIVFAFILFIYSLSVWVKEHIRNAAIIRIYGFDMKDILKKCLVDILKTSAAALMTALVFDVLFFLISETSLTYIFNFSGLVWILIFFAASVILTGFYVYIKIKRYPLSYIIKEHK